MSRYDGIFRPPVPGAVWVTMYLRRFYLILLLLITAGCDSLGFPFESPIPEATPTSTLAPSLPPTPILAPSPDVQPTSAGPVTITLWLPPKFDPGSGTEAGNLLAARLEEFSLRRPGVRLDVRVKALDGAGGLLDSLSAASAAAPLALPDLIALPRPLMEAAALKGLLHPLDPLTHSLDNSDWYDYAIELSRLQDTSFGIPLAGDALLLAYRPAVILNPPMTWEDVLVMEHPLIFTAADPQALTTLTLYMAAGGPVQDDQGRPTLDAAILTQLLTFYQSAEISQVMPFWLTQYETFDQAWAGYADNPTALTITWLSRYLQEEATLAQALPGPAEEDFIEEDPLAAALLPTPSGIPFTLANGWTLSLAGAQPSRQPLALELAEFLTESNFLASFTEVAYLLPPREETLAAWTNDPAKALVRQVASSAHLFPSSDVLTSLAPHLQQATLQILKQQAEPVSLAQMTVERLMNP
jgi:multiple sugar transport system substrate-binding protein